MKKYREKLPNLDHYCNLLSAESALRVIKDMPVHRSNARGAESTLNDSYSCCR
ncbi:hypothetical protein X777_03594 [Ooceraea biroi]|uniref:Uncharacterized protein n=1 Tax=Ooceraea biroi TaxID=2015173 RepID=A0A026WJI3_OOCBI|nr:hypothetical protein X777_03594 [Ooceraea biroi]